MKKLEASSIDMVLADLPYGTTACKWDSVIPFEPLWAELHRVCKPAGALCMFGSEPFSTKLRASNLKRFKYDWIWEKSICGDIFNAKNKPLKKHEVVSVFSSGTTANGSLMKMNYFPQGLKDCERTVKNKETVRAFFAPRPSHAASYKQTKTGYPVDLLKFKNDTGHHPTQKPVALLEYLIKTYTNEGDTVLDPTMGSGSTGVACRNLGRKFVGIERDEKYFAIASQRIAQTHQQMHM